MDNGGHLPWFYGSTFVPLMWGCDKNTAHHLAVLARLSVLNYPGGHGVPTSLNSSSQQQWDLPQCLGSPPLVPGCCLAEFFCC